MRIADLPSVAAQIEHAIANGPIVADVTPQQIRDHLAARYNFTKAMALDEVIDDVEQMLRTWQVQVTHPRYFGLFNPSVTVASVIADTLVALYNPTLATWRKSPAAKEIELNTLAWLTAQFGLPAATRASLTSA